MSTMENLRLTFERLIATEPHVRVSATHDSDGALRATELGEHELIAEQAREDTLRIGNIFGQVMGP